jgi:hypothetical protein
MFSIVDRTQLNISRVGIEQAMNGQIVMNPIDRKGLAELLCLIAVSEMKFGNLITETTDSGGSW